jgi:hypothetical protein
VIKTFDLVIKACDREISALGQKQTFAHVRFTPKMDMCGATSDVRFGPKADISSTIESGHPKIPNGLEVWRRELV